MTYRYDFRTTPWEHQRQAMRHAFNQEGFAWLMEMGTGKTKVAIDEISMFYEMGKIDCAVIFAPKGVYRNWLREFQVHMPLRILDKANILDWRSGATATHSKALNQLLEPSPGRLRVLVINIEAISSSKKARVFARSFVKSGKCAGYLDESTTIKHPNSNRSQALIELARMEEMVRRRIMTGWPITNSPLDAYNQFEFCGPSFLGFSSWYSFRGRYAHLKKITGQGTRADGKQKRSHMLVVGYKNEDDLRDRIGKRSFRKLKSECMDLPPKITLLPREIEMSDEQAHAYTQMREYCWTYLDSLGSVTAPIVLTQLMRLQQIACGFTKLDDTGEIVRFKHFRLEELGAAIEETSGKSIIWCPFVPAIEDIISFLRNEYGSKSVVHFYGATGDKEREDNDWRFQNDSHTRFMVANQQTGGRGRTWTAASSMFFYANTHSSELRIQSEDRAHRGGLKHPVSIQDIVVKGTRDLDIIKTLQGMRDLAAYITGDNWREWI